MVRRVSELLTGSLIVFAFAVPAIAQGGRAEINGTVIDTANAVVPGVTVTVTEENTGLQRTTISSADGRYVVPTLLPGRYTIKAELQGFQTATQTGLVLLVGQELTVQLTLQIGGVTEQITVTGESPIVEVTSSRVGTNITNAEIDTLPAAGRNQLSLMQLVPGLTPSLVPGSFEGGQYNANGQATTANVFLVDGAYDNDDRRGGSQGTQARVTLDTMAEYEVLTHHYSAEYGGSSGAIVNTVTRSGSNRLRGRAFYYSQNDDLNATNYFLKQAGRQNPESSSNVFGGSAGGPIVRNKAFWFVNVERNLQQQAANLNFPANAAPLAVSYSDTTDFTGWNTFVRSDYQLTGNNHLSFRWVREAVLTENDELEGNNSTPDNATFENDSGDQVFSFAATSVLGNRATNEFKVGHVRENLLQGPRLFFDDGWNFIGLDGREQFDLGSMNSHPDYNAGNRNNYQEDLIRSLAIDDSFTYLKSGWHGDHTFKVGAGWSRNAALPQGTAANLIGLFTFPSNTAFNPADPRTYPFRFQIRLGQIDYTQKDWRTQFYVQDKWQIHRQLTLNLGLRYNYQDLTPLTKDAFAPRFGIAYDVKGNGKTLVRAGFGKFYQLHQLNVHPDALDGGSDRADLRLRHGSGRAPGSDRCDSDRSVQFGMPPVSSGEQRLGPDWSRVPRVPDHAQGPGQRRRVREQPADGRRRSPDAVSVGVQRRREARVDPVSGRFGRLRRERGPRPGSTRRHQRGPAERPRSDYQTRCERIRPERRDHPTRGAKHRLHPRASVPVAQRIQYRLQRAGNGAGEAAVESMVGPGQLHARSRPRCGRHLV